MKSQIANGVYYSSLLLFMDRGCIRQFDSDQLLVLTIVLIIACRFILQPVIADRFYIPYYLCIAILLAKKLAFKIYP
jgi:hypothetical protein